MTKYHRCSCPMVQILVCWWFIIVCKGTYLLINSYKDFLSIIGLFLHQNGSIDVSKFHLFLFWPEKQRHKVIWSIKKISACFAI